jgi:hypothetical protein
MMTVKAAPFKGPVQQFIYREADGTMVGCLEPLPDDWGFQACERIEELRPIRQRKTIVASAHRTYTLYDAQVLAEGARNSWPHETDSLIYDPNVNNGLNEHQWRRMNERWEAGLPRLMASGDKTRDHRELMKPDLDLLLRRRAEKNRALETKLFLEGNAREEKRRVEARRFERFQNYREYHRLIDLMYEHFQSKYAQCDDGGYFGTAESAWYKITRAFDGYDMSWDRQRVFKPPFYTRKQRLPHVSIWSDYYSIRDRLIL